MSLWVTFQEFENTDGSGCLPLASINIFSECMHTLEALAIDVLIPKVLINLGGVGDQCINPSDKYKVIINKLYIQSINK